MRKQRSQPLQISRFVASWRYRNGDKQQQQRLFEKVVVERSQKLCRRETVERAIEPERRRAGGFVFVFKGIGKYSNLCRRIVRVRGQ